MGTRRRMTEEKCSYCTDGYIATSTTCEHCSGSGRTYNSSGDSYICRPCDGSGSITQQERCDHCGGRGYIFVENVVTYCHHCGQEDSMCNCYVDDYGNLHSNPSPGGSGWY